MSDVMSTVDPVTAPADAPSETVSDPSPPPTGMLHRDRVPLWFSQAIRAVVAALRPSLHPHCALMCMPVPWEDGEPEDGFVVGRARLTMLFNGDDNKEVATMEIRVPHTVDGHVEEAQMKAMAANIREGLHAHMVSVGIVQPKDEIFAYPVF